MLKIKIMKEDKNKTNTYIVFVLFFYYIREFTRLYENVIIKVITKSKKSEQDRRKI